MATGSYTLQQQAFTISVLSNNAAGQTGTAQQIAQYLEGNVTTLLGSDTFQKYIGNWKLVWGPVVWQNSGSQYADNVMLAAQNQDTNDIAVGIAGTNPNSAYDRGIEDLDVGTTVNFDTATGSWISQGASDGVSQLEDMESSTNTLLEYLNGLSPTNANLIIAGHSLGGALSPVLALDLVLKKNLNTANFSNVYVYPTAGPSPGNDAFAALFAKTFPAVGSTAPNVWNQNVVNSLDAVPHGWTDLATLPSIYPPINNGNPIDCVQIIVNDKLTPALNGNVYADIQRVTFEGFFNEGLTPPASGVFCDWLTQVIYQHIPAYFAEILPALQGSLSVPTLPGSICREIDTWCDVHRG